MEPPKVNVPKRWWWLVAIALPLAWGVVDGSLRLFELLRSTGGRETLAEGVIIQGSTIHGGRIVGGDYHEGDRIETDLAITTVSVMMREIEEVSGAPLSDRDRALLEQAIAMVEDGAYRKAVPVLETIARSTPVPSVLSNLGAAYLAEGQEARARATLERAVDTADEAPESAVAARYNLQQIRSVADDPGGPAGNAHATAWDGVMAEVTRLEDTGGMLTLEARYWNVGQEPLSIDVEPWNSYLLDELNGRKTTYTDYGGRRAATDLEPGNGLFVWTKFKLPQQVPPQFTVVLYGVPQPFEGVPFGFRQE